ncbi:MAG TPA: hypothetical protein VGE59_01035 [Patescibacteria group bacterium]
MKDISPVRVTLHVDREFREKVRKIVEPAATKEKLSEELKEQLVDEVIEWTEILLESYRYHTSQEGQSSKSDE